MTVVRNMQAVNAGPPRGGAAAEMFATAAGHLDSEPAP